MRFRIFGRRRSEVNTDPLRRCYYGCHARSEFVWSDWYSLGTVTTEKDAIESVNRWKDVNKTGDHDYKYEAEEIPS